MLNESKGNMYNWITHTWNAIKGECPHHCSYCYMKRWGRQKPVRLVGSELRTDLGSGNMIFVGSSCDMWASSIPDEWILATLAHCRKYDRNKYLFQSKDPARIREHHESLPGAVMLGTTIESDRRHPEMADSPQPIERAKGMIGLRHMGFEIMVTIEPVMDFYLSGLVDMVRAIRPSFVNIGANTNAKIELSEPSPEKLENLISQVGEFCTVRVKPNLKRLLPAPFREVNRA